MLLSGQTSSALNILIGYVYAAVPLSGLVIAFYNVVHIVEATRMLNGSPEPSSPEADA
jgi:TRAP-type C4-dicarboxylate transport system permease small subunit